MTIRMAVGQLIGVTKVSGEEKSSTIALQYIPSDVTVESIQDRLRQIGYESTVLA